MEEDHSEAHLHEARLHEARLHEVHEEHIYPSLRAYKKDLYPVRDPSVRDTDNYSVDDLYPNNMTNNMTNTSIINNDPSSLEIINKRLRIQNFLDEKKYLEEILAHYSKLKNNWTRIDSGIKISLISIGGFLGATSVVLTGISTLGGSLILYIGVGIGVATTFTSILGESISVGLSSKKKKVYREVVECIQDSINKLYFFQIKALEDHDLSDSEILASKKILLETKEEIKKIKSGVKIQYFTSSNKEGIPERIPPERIIPKNIRMDIQKKVEKEMIQEIKDKIRGINIPHDLNK